MSIVDQWREQDRFEQFVDNFRRDHPNRQYSQEELKYYYECHQDKIRRENDEREYRRQAYFGTRSCSSFNDDLY